MECVSIVSRSERRCAPRLIGPSQYLVLLAFHRSCWQVGSCGDAESDSHNGLVRPGGALLTFPARHGWHLCGFSTAAGRWHEATERCAETRAGLILAALIGRPFIWENAAYLGVRFNAGGSSEDRG
jgi:hypothetical protein